MSETVPLLDADTLTLRSLLVSLGNRLVPATLQILRRAVRDVAIIETQFGSGMRRSEWLTRGVGFEWQSGPILHFRNRVLVLPGPPPKRSAGTTLSYAPDSEASAHSVRQGPVGVVTQIIPFGGE